MAPTTPKSPTIPNRPDQQPAARRYPTAVMVLLVLMLGAWSVWQIYQEHRWANKQWPNPQLHVGVGEPLTLLDLRPLTGRPAPLSVDKLEGRVILLNFWGTWCRPCRDELPHMAALRERFAGQKTFELISVSYPPVSQHDDPESLGEETKALLKKLGIDLPTYYDPGNRSYTALCQLLGMKNAAFPLSVLLDKQGLIQAVWVGYRPGLETEMERYIDDQLSETE